MTTGAEELFWSEVLALDSSLQDFVAAEITRAGIEFDTLRWQQGHDRALIAALVGRLDDAKAEVRALRRRLKLPDDFPTERSLPEVDG